MLSGVKTGLESVGPSPEVVPKMWLSGGGDASYLFNCISAAIRHGCHRSNSLHIDTNFYAVNKCCLLEGMMYVRTVFTIMFDIPHGSGLPRHPYKLLERLAN